MIGYSGPMRVKQVEWAFDQVIHDMTMRLMRMIYAHRLPDVLWWRGQQLGRYFHAPYWDDTQ